VSRNFLRATTAKQTAAGLLAVCSVGSCLAAGALDPQGPVGSAERLILLNSTAIMLVVVVPVIVLTPRAGPAVLVQGMARQPIRWVATHLRQHGAMVASGILTGYAGRFAAHILKHRPTLTSALTKVTRAAGDENRLSVDMYRAMPRSSMRSLRWWPPMFPQRAFPVYRCGWKGLHTARAVARISASCLPVIGSIRQHQTEPESQRATARMVEPVDFDLANLECDAFDVSRNLRRGRPSLV
jgi:hypothetical protein